MKLLKIAAIASLLLTACNKTDKSDKSPNISNSVYDFAETKDDSYCDPNSIVASDCGGGVFYFSKNGFVLYSFYCMGSDTTTFDIGKYTETDQKTKCTFDKSYSYFNGYNAEDDEKPLPFDPNSGTVKPEKSWTIDLQKLTCDKYEFGFQVRNENKFALGKTSPERSKYFFDELGTIPKLEEFWK